MVLQLRSIFSVGFILLSLVFQSAFGSIGLDSTGIDDATGQRVVVRSIILNGNHRTHDRIILREMSLKAGDTLRRSELPGKLIWDQRNINNTNLFITVDVTAKPVADVKSITVPPDTISVVEPLQQVDVEVVMKERWYIILYPVFDLADRNFNEWWYDRGRDLRRVIYGGRLSWRNFTGANDRLQAVLELGFLRRTVLSYQRPYIDKAQKTGLRVDVGYITNKEIPYRTSADKWLYIRSEGLLRERAYASVALTRRQGLYHYHSLETRLNRNSIADTVARLNPDYFGDGRTQQRYLSLTYGYRYDRRDNVAYPLHGTLLTGVVGLNGLLPSDNFRQLEMSASLTRYWGLGGKFYMASGVRGRATWATQQPYFNLRALGSSLDMIRGYELYVIDGQRFGIWRNSLRYELLKTRKQLDWLRIRQFNTVPIAAYLTAFADMGYVGSSVAEQYQSRLANRTLVGTGVSLDIVTFYNMVFRFNAVVNGQGHKGFYFNLMQEL